VHNDFFGILNRSFKEGLKLYKGDLHD